MALSNFLNRGPTSVGGSGGLSRLSPPMQQQFPDYTNQIFNAQQRLTAVGQPLPVVEDKQTVLDRVFEVLNFLNNKKNQGLSYVTGNEDAFGGEVSGADLLQQWGMQEGMRNQVAGFGFDVLTDPLNFLTFGAGTAASAAAKGVAKTGQLSLEGAAKAPTVAKLGAFGNYFEVPGSAEAIDAVGGAVKGAASKLGSFIEKNAPELAQAGRNVKDLGGRLFIRGYGIPGTVNQLTKKTEDLLRMDTQDIVGEITTITKEWKDVDNLKLIKAVENPSFFTELNPQETEAFQSVKDFFDVNFLKAQEAGVLDDFRANYIPHIFKGKKEEVAAALEQMRRRGPRMNTNSPFGNERTLLMELSEIMDNPELAAKLKPETDIAKIMGIYSLSLQRAIRNRDMIDELVGLGPEIIVHSKDDVVPPGWVNAPVQQLKGYSVPPDIARHLKDVLEPFMNSDSANKLFKYYDDVLGWWKGMATIPNPGFHFRNYMGNLFNSYLAGMRGVDQYRLAHLAQKADDSKLDDFYNLIRQHGEEGLVPFGTPLEPNQVNISRLFDEDRFRDFVTGGDGPKVKVNFGGRTEEVNMQGVKLLAKLQGVTGRGFIAGDISDTIGDTLRKLRGQRSPQEMNPLSRQNPIFSGAENIGQYLEDNSRLALFVDQLQKGHTPLDSGLTVKKYLFDYTQLTPFEKNVMKRFMPFYAFTRFNLPLQLAELVKQPKYATMMGKFQDFADGLATEITGEDIDQKDVPRYIRDLYSVRLPFQVADRDVTFGVDLPIRDVNSMRPMEVFTMLTPFITVPFEQIANRNVYFGRDLERYEGETVKAPGYLQGLFKAVKAMDEDAPQSDMFNKIANNLGFTVAINQDNGQPELRIPVRAAHLLNQMVGLKNAGKVVDLASGESFDPFNVASTLTGVSASSSTHPQRQASADREELQKLEDLMRKLRDEGRPVPTLKDLQDQGRLLPMGR